MEDPPAPAEAPANGASAPTTAAAASGETLVPCPSKRQRRPSVRLGDPGEQPAAVIPSLDSFSRRPRPPPHLQWRHHAPYSRDPSRPPSKTRPLIHLHAPTEEDAHAPAPALAPSDDRSALLPVDENFEPLASAFRRTGAARPKKPKRVRSGWAPPPSKIDELADATAATDHKFCGEDGFREGSESPSDNRGYMGPTTEPADGDAPSETDGDGHNWNNKNDYGWCRSVEDGGVRSWLNGLGLARYAPVFEIHEVDDEVLPLLTLEDLKDMGINAVGSRRKMYCAIQKLRKSLA